MSVGGAAVLRATGLSKSFPLRRNAVGRVVERTTAVDGVDLSIGTGKTLGLVGESGSGKSTVARMLALLIQPDQGSIELNGAPLTGARRRARKDFHARLQVIFQDPYGALDPTKTVGHAIAEPLLVHRRVPRGRAHGRVRDLLARVALDPNLASRYPEELSGGQRQRVCIARALALEPDVLIADEPTSALDLSTRAEILNLLLEIQRSDQLSMVLVSHDFASVQHLAHEIAVMYLGRIVESGPTAEVVGNPRHPYTRALLSAVQIPDPAKQRARQRTRHHT